MSPKSCEAGGERTAGDKVVVEAVTPKHEQALK